MRTKHTNVILTYHVDRRYRRLADLEPIVTLIDSTRSEVVTVAAGDVDLRTATGKQLARMMGAMAQGERERTGERLRAKSDELARAGRPPGGRSPYGYGPGYVVNEEEARWVRWAADRALAG